MWKNCSFSVLFSLAVILAGRGNASDCFSYHYVPTYSEQYNGCRLWSPPVKPNDGILAFREVLVKIYYEIYAHQIFCYEYTHSGCQYSKNKFNTLYQTWGGQRYFNGRIKDLRAHMKTSDGKNKLLLNLGPIFVRNEILPGTEGLFRKEYMPGWFKEQYYGSSLYQIHRFLVLNNELDLQNSDSQKGKIFQKYIFTNTGKCTRDALPGGPGEPPRLANDVEEKQYFCPRGDNSAESDASDAYFVQSTKIMQAQNALRISFANEEDKPTLYKLGDSSWALKATFSIGGNYWTDVVISRRPDYSYDESRLPHNNKVKMYFYIYEKGNSHDPAQLYQNHVRAIIHSSSYRFEAKHMPQVNVSIPLSANAVKQIELLKANQPLKEYFPDWKLEGGLGLAIATCNSVCSSEGCFFQPVCKEWFTEGINIDSSLK